MTTPGAVGRTENAPVVVSSSSTEQTREFGAALAGAARAGDRLALHGPLGAGKTQFVKGFARGLGVREVVNSPSFTLMAEYSGRLPLFHQDLYRLSGADEVLAGGLIDERQADGVTLSEWAERLPDEVEPGRLAVSFEVLADESRLIRLVPGTADHDRYLAAARAWAAAHATGSSA